MDPKNSVSGGMTIRGVPHKEKDNQWKRKANRMSFIKSKKGAVVKR